jgi:multiple sugar transport system permease protein
MADLRRARRALREAAFAASIVALAAAVVFPFFWMVKSSLESGSDLFAYPLRFVPETVSLAGYRAVFRDTGLGLWLWNSFVVAAVSTLLALAAGVSGAYGLSRFRYRGKSTLALVILTTQMMPPLVLIIPLYTIFVRTGLADSIAGLVLGNFAFSLPVVIWMMKSIFDAIPFEIEEAARVDGASWPYILWRIVLPVALPGLVATGIFAFLNGWDEFMLARTIVSSARNWVGTIGLASFVGAYLTPWDQVLAAATVFTLPPLVLFLLVQRYFIAGLGAGAVKA